MSQTPLETSEQPQASEPTLQDSQPTLPAPEAVSSDSSAPSSEEASLKLYDPEIDAQPPLDMYGPEDVTPTPSSKTVQDRAKKLHWVMDKSPGEQTLQSLILSGMEGNLRRNLSDLSSIRDFEDRQAKLNSFVEAKTKEDKPGVSDAEASYVATLVAPPERTDPNTVIEKEVGKRTTQELLTNNKEFGKDALEGTPDQALDKANGASLLLSKQQYAQTLLQDTTERYNTKNWAYRALDWTANQIPLVTALGLHDALGPQKDLMPGNNLREQIQDLYASPDLKTFKDRLDTTVEALFKKDPYTALQFVQAVTHSSSDDYSMLNVSAVGDIVGNLPLGTIAKGTAVAGALAFGVHRAMKAASSGFDAVKMADVALKADADLRVAQTIMRDRAAANGKPGSWKDVEAEVPGLINPQTITGGSYNFLSREPAKRLYIFLTNLSKDLTNGMINDPTFIDRMSNAHALDAAKIAMHDVLRGQYPGIEDRIMDIRYESPVGEKRGIANVHQGVVTIGDEDGAPFKGQMQAYAALRDYNISGAKIVRQGAGWAVELRKPLSEVEPTVRANMLKELTGETKFTDPMTQQGVFMKFLNFASQGSANRFRSYEDLLNSEIMKDFHTAQHGSSKIAQVFAHMAQETGLPSMRKESREALDKFLTIQRTDRNDLNPNKIGRWSRTYGEFESEWNHQFSRLPTEGETQAYFFYQYATNVDYIVRNLGAFRDKWRLGLEMHNLPFVAPGPTGSKLMVNNIEGKSLQKLPDHVWDNTNPGNRASVMVLDNNPNTKWDLGGGARQIFDTFFTKKKTFEDAFPANEWKVVQLTPDGEQALRDGLGGPTKNAKSIDYILVKQHGSSPLPLKQIPGTEGGHNVYPLTGAYGKQPNIGERFADTGRDFNVYYGDKTFMYFNSMKEAQEWVPKFDKARELYRDWKNGKGTEIEYRKYVDSNLPSDYVGSKKFDDMFEKYNYDVDHPFLPTPSGTNTMAYHKLVDRYKNLIRFSDSPNNLLAGRDLEFMMEKDQPLMTIKDTGNTTAPLYSLTKASMVDPITTMNRTFNDLMKGRLLDDLKVKGVEQFIQRYGKYLKPSQKELETNPIRAALSPDWRTDVKGEELEGLRHAQDFQRSLANFLHLKDENQQYLSWLEQKAMQHVYGAEMQGKTAPLSRWALTTIKDPASFMRGLAFDLRLGFFNPTIFFKQMTAMVHIAGIEGPVWATKGTTLAWWFMHPVVGINSDKKIIEALATKMGSVVGVKPRDLIEATDYLRRSGFAWVGKEQAQLNDFMDASFAASKAERIRELGRRPFQKGDQLPRLAGYATAFLKWRAENPTKAFTDAIGQSLVQRADLTTGNMTGASLADIQKGWGGVMTQFATYPWRMFEQYTGKRLTVTEKARLFATYSAAFGVPVAGSVVVGVSDMWNKEKLEQGIRPQDNVLTNFLDQGGGGLLVQAFTGERTNFSNIYGPSGISFFNDIINGDKSAFQMALGAFGGVINDFRVDPLASMMAHAMDVSGKGYKFIPSDIAEFLRISTSMNQLAKAYAAYNWGIYATKNGVVYDKASGLDALLMGALGVTPERVMDAFLLKKIQQDKGRVDAMWESKIATTLQDAWRHLDAQDYDRANDDFKKINGYMISGGLDPYQVQKAYRNAYKGALVPMADQVWQKQFRNVTDPKYLDFWRKQMNERDEETHGSE